MNEPTATPLPGDLTVTFDMDDRDWRAIYAEWKSAVAPTPPAPRVKGWPRIVLMLCMGASVLALAFIVINHGNPGRGTPLWLTLSMVAVFIGCGSVLAEPKRRVVEPAAHVPVEEYLAHYIFGAMSGAWSVTLTERGVTIVEPTQTMHLNWPALGMFHHGELYVSIVLATNRSVYVPTRAFNAGVAAQAFVDEGNRRLYADGQGFPHRMILWLGRNDLPCPKCRYNLRGTMQLKCPECGRVLSVEDTPGAFKRTITK